MINEQGTPQKKSKPRSRSAGKVIDVTETEIIVRSAKGRVQTYPLKKKEGELLTEEERTERHLVWPRTQSWQEPVVEVGEQVKKRELLARGVTEIFFQANIWVFTGLSLVLGAVMGVGKAAVYKHIPDYFPDDVGVVGGIVGVLGGLGGFICPVIFGYLLRETGLWTSCWVFFFFLVLICLAWMHMVIQRMTMKETPEAMKRF